MSTPTAITPLDAEQCALQTKDSIPTTAPPDAETPADYIPGLYTLGSTYNVLNGKYADSKSALQQVIDWDKTESRLQQYAGKTYSIPKIVNYVSDTTSTYRSYYGKTTTEYSHSLSVQAGFESTFPGFSASASADYSDSERENLANAFTRVTYVVTEYDLSLPPLSQLPKLLKSWFIEDLDNMDPIKLYKQYGTHILSSLTIGGRASFLTATDSRTYSSEMSIEAAAHITAQYLVASGNVDFSASEKQAFQSFRESSSTKVETRGGDPRYGNEQFLSNAAEWAASVNEYPEFIDFGATPCFVGLWELASNGTRRNELETAYKTYVDEYKAALELPGPYLRSRFTTDFVEATTLEEVAVIELGASLRLPKNRTNEWYHISPGLDDNLPAVIASELVEGALAQVRWEKAFDLFVNSNTLLLATFWRAIPPTSDYVALGAVGVYYSDLSNDSLDQPPKEMVARFRAVHKSALIAATNGVDHVCHGVLYDTDGMIFGVDSTYWYADTDKLNELDCKRLDPKNVIMEDSKQFAKV